MKDLKIFNNNEFGEIRTILDEKGEPWFVGKDIAQILEYSSKRRLKNDCKKINYRRFI